LARIWRSRHALASGFVNCATSTNANCRNVICWPNWRPITATLIHFQAAIARRASLVRGVISNALAQLCCCAWEFGVRLGLSLAVAAMPHVFASDAAATFCFCHYFSPSFLVKFATPPNCETQPLAASLSRGLFNTGE
jgi:hypothetical protein